MPTWGIKSYGASGIEDVEGRDANVLLSGGTAVLCDGGALRDSLSSGHVYGDGYPLL